MKERGRAMKLINAVRAYLAAEEMSRQAWPYDMALAIVKVKRATGAEKDFFVEKERELVMKYADLDERGNIRLTQEGRFLFRDRQMADEYERERRELENAETGDRPAPLRVKAPERIKPEHIEALDGFIEFEGEEK